MYGSNSEMTIYMENVNNEVENEIKRVNGVYSCNIDEKKIILSINKKELNFTEVFKILENNNLEIENFSMKETNLEEIFLNLTGKKLRD